MLIFWQAAVGSGLVESRMLPSPAKVFAVLIAETANGALVHHAAATITRALAGFTLAVLVGIPFAAAMARSALWRNLFEPIFFLGYPVPKIALFPVFTCFFGFRGIQTRLVWTAANFGASRAVILGRVILPAALPNIFAGLRLALPVA